MRETRELLTRLRELRAAGAPAAVATIVAVDGSAYRREGARMLIEPDNRLTGVLSGGCVERELLAPAREVLASGAPRAIVFDLSADEEAIWGFGLGCSGTLTLLLEPLTAAVCAEPLTRALAESIDRRLAVRLTTRLRVHDARRVDLERHLERIDDADSFERQEATTSIEGKDKGQSTTTPEPSAAELGPPLPLHWKSLAHPAEALPIAETTPTQAGNEKEGKEGSFSAAPAGEVELVETIVPPAHLVLIGAERDVVPLVDLAHGLGWQATVVDARPTPAAAARVAGRARYVGAPPRRLADEVTLDRRTAVLVATHRYLDDLAYLGELADAPLGYLGLLGPTKRRERLLADLARQHPSSVAERATGLRGPAGLDLGGRSPHEVALAVVAEIQAALSGASARPLSRLAEERAASRVGKDA